MGNVAAASELTAANNKFEPDVVLFVGVAGSVKPDDLCRGDVVVGSHAYNIHAGKDTLDDAGRPVSLGRPLGPQASYGLVQLATAVRQQQWTGELLLLGSGEARNARGGVPHVEIRGIAAGEVVHADSHSALMERVRTRFNDVAAVDMESFGLYRRRTGSRCLPSRCVASRTALKTRIPTTTPTGSRSRHDMLRRSRSPCSGPPRSKTWEPDPPRRRRRHLLRTKRSDRSTTPCTGFRPPLPSSTTGRSARWANEQPPSSARSGPRKNSGRAGSRRSRIGRRPATPPLIAAHSGLS